MGKKRSCQDVREPRLLNEAEAQLYGWVEEEVFTQPSVIQGDFLPELCRNIRLMGDAESEGDYVLEAAGPSDRVPFRAERGSPHFLWVYQEHFTRLRVSLPFSDFQRDVLTRCKFGFHPTARMLLYIYDVLVLPPGKGYVSFRAHQGRKMLGSYEESIQEFKWHYFKVLSSPGKRAFWLDDEGNPFPWVYWNPEVKDFTVYILDPLEMAACKFLLSLPAGLPKKNDFPCRWILDHSDAEVAQFLGGLLEVKMRQNRLDKLRAQLAYTSKMGPCSILPVSIHLNNPSAIPSAAAGTSSSADADASLRKKVPPGTICLDAEEGVKEDPSADLRRKRQKRKQDEVDLTDWVLGENSAWEHDVHPVDLAFLDNFDYRKTVDGGVASSYMRRSLVNMPPEQLLGESYRFTTKALACFQVGLEGTIASKLKTEKELAAAQDQISVQKAERDSGLAYLPLKEKVDTLNDQLSEKEGERQSALDRVAQLEEDNKVLSAQLASCQLSLEKEQKKVEAAEKDVKALNSSLVERQAALGAAYASAKFWEAEWKKLGEETLDMCQETLEIVLDQVSHLCPRVDF
ncbi:hypothetical protein PIB30_007047 [Stylosanthes scabra]|uniref:Transposase (Putative), gypsy type n=1 Tax=Stylosanthes scabra TaxID=79078 RepID=A0ABU6Q4H1_9FABA|nr:hypothetical protein [Stylosanthes scabra]